MATNSESLSTNPPPALSVSPSRDDTLAEISNEKKDSGELAPASLKPVADGDDAEKGDVPPPPNDEDRYITGWKLAFMFGGLLFSVFLIALDQTIVATALPVIASKFNALSDITWIVSAYFLTQAGLMLTFGQVISVAPTKWVYLFCIIVFEIGSLFCAVAWNVEFLIFGRAVAGVGAAGIFVSILVIVAEVTRLEQRPLLFGLFGGIFAVASVAGPLLGGAFTDHVSWRWCFYINLPFGAISVAAICFLVPAKPPPGHDGSKIGWKAWIFKVDWIGTFLALGMITPLLLALQWGGILYPWNHRIEIAMFVVFAVMLPAFVGWEWHRGNKAMMPLVLWKRRTQVGATVAAFFVFFNLILATYYLPFFYQAKGSSATDSGLKILPYMLTVVIAAALSGGVINFTGRYWPFLVAGPLLGAVGAGLLYTIDMNTSSSKLVGFQILYGAGVGFAMQNTVIAIQCEYAFEEALIPQGTAIVNFLQLVGGIIGIAIAGSIFGNKLEENVAIYAPGLDPHIVDAVKQSITVVFTLPVEMQPPVIEAYVASLKWVFIAGIPTSIMASVCGAVVKNYSVHERGSKMMAAGH